MPGLDQVHGNEFISFSCHSSLSAHNTQGMSTTQASITMPVKQKLLIITAAAAEVI